MNNPTLSSHYDERARVFGKTTEACHYRTEQSFRQRQKIVRDLLGGLDGKKILDIGCGNGLFSAPLALKSEVIGVDLSHGMLELARDSLKPVQGCGEILPFQTGAFDGVLAAETLQHLAQPEPFIQEIARVLKPGGEWILSALNRQSLLHRIFRAGGRDYRMLHFHSLREVQALLEKSGLPVDQVIFLGFPFDLSWKGARADFRAPFAASWILKGRRA